jgi:hypothetical protein
MMTNTQLAIAAIEDHFNACPDCDDPTAELLADYADRSASVYEKVHGLLKGGDRLERAVAMLMEKTTLLENDPDRWDSSSALQVARASADAYFEDVAWLYDSYCESVEAIYHILTASNNAHP